MSGTSRMMIGGVVKGTGAALEVKGDKVGFRPNRVELSNITDGSSAVWQESMPDAAMAKQKAAVTSYVTANGITPLGSGFRLGADADLNAAADEIHFTAWG